MKLHLGCGRVKLEGWLNVDLDPSKDPERLDDIRSLHTIEDGSCDIIYASHVLEHTGRSEWQDVLKTWVKKLKVGGVLRLAVPDFGAVVQRYSAVGDIKEVTGLVCGGQRDELDYHKIIFDEKRLGQAMQAEGLIDVHRWDWRLTEHSHLDDYSQAYLPHMAKDTGLLMSLNLEGRKC